MAWAASLAALWAMLNPGDHKSWVIGIPVIACSTAVAWASACGRPRRISVAGAVRFAAFFVEYSFRGGWDVARRAFSPSLPLKPAMLSYRLRLRDSAAQVLLVNVVSLLPGTVSAGLEDGVMTLHALDGGPATLEETALLEQRIAAVFGLQINEERSVSDE